MQARTMSAARGSTISVNARLRSAPSRGRVRTAELRPPPPYRLSQRAATPDCPGADARPQRRNPRLAIVGVETLPRLSEQRFRKKTGRGQQRHTAHKKAEHLGRLRARISRALLSPPQGQAALSDALAGGWGRATPYLLILHSHTGGRGERGYGRANRRRVRIQGRGRRRAYPFQVRQ